MAKSPGSPRPRWPLVSFGSAVAVVAVLVIVGLASNGMPATHTASRPAPTPGSSATPTATASPPSATLAGALRQDHTVRTEPDDMGLRAGQCHVVTLEASAGAFLPDAACTPGAIDPAVTEATIGSTICVSGYTAGVRPPTSVTGPAKSSSLADYGMARGPTVEYDHLVPLELGGASTVSNLWPEPNKTAAKGVNNPKDAVENALKKAVCDHRVLLAAAQNAIASNWTTAEGTLGLG